MKMKKKPILISLLSLVLCMAMVFGFMYRSPLVAFAISSPEDNQYVFDNGEKIQVVSWYDADPNVYSQRHKFENPEKPGTYLWWDETTLTYNESTGKWKADSPMRWQNVDKDGNPNPHHCFLAYYPASLASPDSVLTAIPITLTGDIKKDDYMFARWIGQRPQNDNVIDLGFFHLMAKLDVNLNFGSQYENVTDVVVKAELAQSGTLDLINFEVEPVSGTTAWQTFTKQDTKDGCDWSGTTIAVPQDVTDLKVVISFLADGEQKELTYTHPNSVFIYNKVRTTLNLKVGDDKVTVEQVSMNDIDFPFSNGWNNEEDLAGGSHLGLIDDTRDAGKTAWKDGDQIIATLTSQYYGEQTATLTYDGTAWSTDLSFSYLNNETPAIKAVYAPSNVLGTGEYIEFDCELNGAELTVKFESATRNYSRLRIVDLPNQELTVYITDFTPAGATESGAHTYSLTTDEKGNAYLYGNFAKDATVSVKNGEITLADHTFSAPTENGRSYVLDAHVHEYENGICDICGKRKVTTITFDTVGGSAVAPIRQECGTAVTAPANPTKTGYAFTGWSPSLPTTMPTEDITVKATWKETGHTVTWKNWDSSVLETDRNVAEGTIPTFNGSTPRKTHDSQYAYVFSGWTPTVVAVTGDATYTANYDAVPLSEYTYQVGDRVEASADQISYCSNCGRLLKNYTATITGVRGVLDGKTIYWVTRECCGHKSSIIETEIIGLA